MPMYNSSDSEGFRQSRTPRSKAPLREGPKINNKINKFKAPFVTPSGYKSKAADLGYTKPKNPLLGRGAKFGKYNISIAQSQA